MNKQRRINSINEIYDSKNNTLLVSLTNLDLSNLDLRKIPSELFDNLIISNCNLENTLIRIDTSKNILFDNCNLRGFDFSLSNTFPHFTIKSCDLRNSNIYIFKNSQYKYSNIKIIDCILPDELIDICCGDFYCEDLYSYNISVDLDTFIKSKKLNLNSFLLFNTIKQYVNVNKIRLDEDIAKLNILLIDLVNERDLEGKLRKMVNEFLPFLNDWQTFRMFNGIIENVNFKNVDFRWFDNKAYKYFTFKNCVFENCNFSSPIEQLYNENSGNTYTSNCTFKNNTFSSLTSDSWKDIRSTRFGPANVPYTIRTNVYVELDRVCNSNCVFCRNNSFDRCKYNKIVLFRTLSSIKPYVHDVVIGGGEPTLYMKELENLIKNRNGIEWYIFSNGSASYDDYDKLSKLGYSLNISRHAKDNDENTKIFGVNSNIDLDIDKIAEINKKYYYKTTLCATCFKGGLDTSEKILEYLIWAQELGFKQVLLSSLHKDNSSGINESYEDINIDYKEFAKVKMFLLQHGFEEKIPIYSTGGYISSVIKNDKFSVIFKTYISKKELEESWPVAIKRTFDLSIDPSGVLHDNWHQKDSGIIVPSRLK